MVCLRELCRNENHSGRRFPDLRIFKGQHIEHMKVRFMMVYVLSRAVGIATNTMALYDEVPPYLIEWAVYGFGSPIVLADSGRSIHLNTDKSGHVRTSLRRFWGLGSLSHTSVPQGPCTKRHLPSMLDAEFHARLGLGRLQQGLDGAAGIFPTSDGRLSSLDAFGIMLSNQSWP